MKLAEFNRIVNPNDETCYIIETPDEQIKNLKFIDIKRILLSRNDVALRMIVPKGLLVIETTNVTIINAIKARNEHVLIAKKEDKYYIYALSDFNKTTVNNLLACGVNANTLAYTKKGTNILLPFHSATNTLPKNIKTNIVYSNGIDKLPLWLQPIKKASSSVISELTLPITENRESTLVSHVTSIASFTREQQKALLKIMNNCLVNPRLDDHTVEALCDEIADSFLSEFMNKNEFYHDKFGNYVIEACNIKKDKKSSVLYFYDNEKNIYTNDPNYLRGYITKLCPRLKQYQKDEAIKYIQDYLETEAVDFNANPFNIVFKNGILHLDNMEFEPMSPEHLESIMINANYNPKAHSDIADTFLDNITCKDENTKTLLLESIGYAMLKTAELAKSFMLTGIGRNGKSTFFELLTAILGENNCTNLAPKNLESNFAASSLVNKLASIAADISGKPLSETDLLKSVAAGDRIMIEKKFKDATEGRVFSTLFFACNKLPRTPDTSDGFYRRWVIIPFDANLSAVKNVEGFMFKNKLLSQESIDYIAYKAVKAIYRVMTETMDFTQPASVVKMLDAYKVNNSSVLCWFKEVFLKNHSNVTKEDKEYAINKLKSEQLVSAYSNYTEWCKLTNKQALARPNFEEEVKSQYGIVWANNESIQ